MVMKLPFADLMLLFGFENPESFTRDEFHFFLDCLFQGLSCFLITSEATQPLYRGYKLKASEILMLVD
jgi:hypothetical protein